MSKSLEKSPSTILIVGCGRLGSRVAQALAKQDNKNILEIILCDYDTVLEGNLAQQPLYKKEDVGKLKVIAAKQHLDKINPAINTTAIPQQFSSKILQDYKHISIILDGTDNLETRQQLNKSALECKIPLIIASAENNNGMVFPVLSKENFPCWQCVVAGKSSSGNCDNGIDNILADKIAKMQAELCRDVLAKKELMPSLHIINIDSEKIIVIRKNISCVCSTDEYNKSDKCIKSSKKSFTLKPCISGKRLIARMTYAQKIDFDKIKKHYMIIKEYENALLVDLKIGTALVHKYGAVEFEGIPECVARKFSEDVLKLKN